MLFKKSTLLISLTIIFSLILINTSVFALDQGTIDFTIEADKMARMEPESPELTLNLSMDKALNQGKIQSNSTSIKFKSNTDIKITFNQKPEKFDYDILNQGIYYELVKEGNTIRSFGVDDQGESYVYPEAGEMEVKLKAKFIPENVNNLEEKWWEMAADSYSDTIIEITITEN